MAKMAANDAKWQLHTAKTLRNTTSTLMCLTLAKWRREDEVESLTCGPWMSVSATTMRSRVKRCERSDLESKVQIENAVRGSECFKSMWTVRSRSNGPRSKRVRMVRTSHLIWTVHFKSNSPRAKGFTLKEARGGI